MAGIGNASQSQPEHLVLVGGSVWGDLGLTPITGGSLSLRKGFKSQNPHVLHICSLCCVSRWELPAPVPDAVSAARCHEPALPPRTPTLLKL